MFKFFKDFADTEIEDRRPIMDVCFCAAYRWPHSQMTGKCQCDSQEICEYCRLPAEVKLVDHGIGPYEFWGARSTHHDWQEETKCCGADLVPNTLKSFMEHRNAKK